MDISFILRQDLDRGQITAIIRKELKAVHSNQGQNIVFKFKLQTLFRKQ